MLSVIYMQVCFVTRDQSVNVLFYVCPQQGDIRHTHTQIHVIINKLY